MTESNREFGDLLTQGLKSIAARENKPILILEDLLGAEMSVTRSTIEKLRQGNVMPDAKKVDYLARICVRRGGMNQFWLRRFLTQARFPDKGTLIHELFPAEEQMEPTIRRNFPGRPYEKFVGREQELARLQQFLSSRHRLGVICLSGTAGVGKTALAIETAYFYYEQYTLLPPDERFYAIVWVTAKQVELLPTGPAARRPTFTDLDGVYRALAEVLDLPAITRAATAEDRDIIVAHALSEHRVLLVMDNMEDIDDPALMLFLRDLPTPSKAIITTRHRIDVAVTLQLRAFNETEARELIRIECHKHALSLTQEQTERLLQRTACLALAIVRTIGRMAWQRSSIEAELQQLGNPSNSIYDFCFERSIGPIRGGDAHKLFMALALFSTGATRDVLGYVAGFQEDILGRDEALSSLEVLSLVNKEGDRFSLEALTKVEAQSELTDNPGFEGEVRERWVEWYLNFVDEYGGADWKEWHIKYDRLEEEWENLLTVFNWCAVHDRYEEIRVFWQLEGVLEFANIIGYWDDRLAWLTWLIQSAERREDWPTMVEIMANQGYTLALMGQLEDASTVLRRAWDLHEYAIPRVQVNTAQNIARLCIYQKRFADASIWLDQAQILLHNAHLSELEHTRRQIITEYYFGRIYFNQRAYEQAEALFREIVVLAQTIGWQRITIYAQNYLADVFMAQSRFDEAEPLLQMGITVSERNKDKRRVANYKSSFAYLYKGQEKLDQAQHWAEAALDGFERLGMRLEAEEMRELLLQIQA